MTSAPAPPAPAAVHYVCNGRIPGPRAHALHAVMMGEALAACGIRVCLFHPARRDGDRGEDRAAGGRPAGAPSPGASGRTTGAAGPDDGPEIAAAYDLGTPFEAWRIPCRDWIDVVGPRWQRIPFLLQSWSFARGLRRELARRPPGLLYVRDPQSLAHLAGKVPRSVARGLVYEAHTFPQTAVGRRAVHRLLPRVDALVVLTRSLAEEYAAAGVSPARILVEPDAMQPRWFEGLGGRRDERRRLGLPPDRPLVGYAGSLLPWKGVPTLIGAVARLDGVGLLLVGCGERDREALLARVPPRERGRFFLVGRVPPREVPRHLRAADVLALPNTARERISSHHTSPLKLFEALASGTPLVASDLPSLREVVTDGESAALVRPDDPAALAHGIQRLLDDRALGERLAAAGREIARDHTWRRRAERVLAFLARLGLVRGTP